LKLPLSDDGVDEFVTMDRRYPMPFQNNTDAWYSFDYGFVHVAAVSSEHRFAVRRV